MITINAGASANAAIWGKTDQGASQGRMATESLPMEHRMLMGTLKASSRALSAAQLTHHWAPTWSLQEVTQFLDGLVMSGHVHKHGRFVTLYSAILSGDQS